MGDISFIQATVKVFVSSAEYLRYCSMKNLIRAFEKKIPSENISSKMIIPIPCESIGRFGRWALIAAILAFNFSCKKNDSAFDFWRSHHP